MYNRFGKLPTVPYRIIAYLAQHNDNIFKLLAYQESDALSRPNLTLEEKLDMIYVDKGREVDKHLFIKPLVGEEMTDSTTQLRIYEYSVTPDEATSATVDFRFDIVTGSKISIVYNEDGIPVSRISMIEAELLDTLNGVDALGTGELQFNRDKSTKAKSMLTLSNSKNFFGDILIMSMSWIDLDTSDTCG